MSGRAAVQDPVEQGADKYLMKFAPRKGFGDGPYNPTQPWLKEFYENGFEVLWDAVQRLERMAHNGETSANVGGPVTVPANGPKPPPEKKPPPPPPAFP